MNWTRLILVLCIFLLCACLVFAITALTALRNAVAETGQVRQEAQSMLDNVEDALRSAQDTGNPGTGSSAGDSAQQVGVLYDQFCIRESGGQVAVYTASGELVRLTGIPVSALPKADREALRDGIRLTSWKEVLALLEDLEG